MTKIILPNSGYRDLLSYQKSDIISRGTALFCERFLPAHGDRTVDQMTQAARSCKQNISEGSAAAGTSIETEIKLTGVAKASLHELLEDYRDHLKTHRLVEWPLDCPETRVARDFARTNSSWEQWLSFLESCHAEQFCNYMIVQIHQTLYLLERMLRWQEEDFKKKGGVRERMHSARTEARAETWDKSMYSALGLSSNQADLEKRLSIMIDTARRMADGIAHSRGWSAG